MERTPEQSLLLLCSRSTLPEAARERVRRLAVASLDWSWVVNAAEAHGIWPLVLTNLKAAAAAVPRAVAEAWDRRFLETTALNLSLTAQLGGVLQLLKAHGIPALAFKGPSLAAAAYGRVGLRSFIDLDVLVPRDTMREGRSVMLANGYSLAGRDSRVFDRVFPRAWREDVFHPTQSGLAPVEVHGAVSTWALAVRLDTRALLDRTVDVDVAGTPIGTLSPDDQLLVLALHGAFHVWSGLKHVADIDAAVRSDLTWEAVFARARSARMTRMLSVALLLARDLLDTDIPGAVLDLARHDRQAAGQASRLAVRLFAPGGSAWKTWVRLQLRERGSDKLRYGVFTAMEEIRRLDRRRAGEARSRTGVTETS